MMPLWFADGMAEYLSVGGLDHNTAMWLRDAVNADHLPRLEDLNSARFFPYRYGQAVWSYLADKYGKRFANEHMQATSRHDFYYELINYDAAKAEYPRIPCFWFFDHRRRNVLVASGWRVC